MSATTLVDQDIEKWIRDALDKTGTHDPDDAVNEWAGWLFTGPGGPFQRWECDDEKCPGRPEWDKALSDVYERVTADIAAAWVESGVRRFESAIRAFLIEHPEASLTTAKVAA
jgi:hypothetical protein